MDIFTKKSRIMVISPLGLAENVKDELTELGYKPISSHDTGVEIMGTGADALRLNLHLRTAQYVLYELAHFRCYNPSDLYEHAHAIAWEDIIPPDSYVTIVSRVDNPSITNTMYPNLKLKDALVDRVQAHCGRRPDSGPDRHRIVVNLRWKGSRATVYLNTTGVKLSDRNYRKLPGKAPLQETLASALIDATGYDGSQNLVLPMCGSGTLAIEAALIALNRPAGSLRTNFAFLHVDGFDDTLWQEIRSQAQRQRRKELPGRIIATDIDETVVQAARKNAQTAGVDTLIEFAVCDFADTPVPADGGIVLMNPEYGQRLGDLTELESLYGRMGDWLKQECAGYDGYVFTGNPALAKKIGLRTKRRLAFHNAKIECRLLHYELYRGTRKSKDALEAPSTDDRETD